MRSPHAALPATSAAHRRWRLVLAVAAPAVLVAAAGLRLVAQERELERRRAVDARRSLAADVRHALVARLEQARGRALGKLAVDSAHEASDTGNPSVTVTVTVIARRNGQRFVPAWEEDAAARTFAIERAAPASATLSLSGRAYRALLRAQRETGAERAASLDGVARMPMAIRDEFGVPLALYGAAALRETAGAGGTVFATVQRASRELLALRTLSPAACHQLRALARDRVAEIERRCEELDKVDELAREASLLPRRPELGPSTPWMYHADVDWLVATSSLGDVTGLLAIRANEALRTLDVSAAKSARVVGVATGAEPLGAEMEGAYLMLPPSAGSAGTWLSSSDVLLAGTLFVVLLTVAGGMLLVRDVRRESETAALRAQFVGSVSHELKTPLAAIRLYAETLRDRPPVAQRQRDEYLGTIVSESERLTRLLDNVLDVSRIERGQKAYALRPLVVNDVVEQAIRVLEYPLSQQGFSLHLRAPDRGVTVLGDADALQQALVNLLVNAMKYSGESRELVVELAVDDGTVQLSVADRGIGIDAREQSRIFEEFYRIHDDATTSVAGAGIGLTIVQHVVAAHGGRVDVSSAPGRGSTFTLHLPTYTAAMPVQATI